MSWPNGLRLTDSIKCMRRDMNFANWLHESSLNDLYSSAVEAFPNTTMRQHATDPIVITNLNWVPYIGMKTLFVKGQAQNEDREYNPMILFKDVRYHQHKDHPKLIKLLANDGRSVMLEKLSFDSQNVLVRCNCSDFHWRMTHWNHKQGSLYGRDRKEYVAKYRPGSANPMKAEAMCKHLMKLSKVLSQSGVL